MNELGKLRQQNQELRDRVQELEELLGMKSKFKAWKKVPPHNLTGLQLQVIECLVEMKKATYNQIFSAVWGNNSEAFSDTLKVHMCRINSTTPAPYKIKKVWGQGLYLTQEGLEYWKKYLEKVYDLPA